MELLKRGAFSWQRWSQRLQRTASIRASSSSTQGTAETTSQESQGPKAMLGSLLMQANKPLTSGEIWASVEDKGFKSKRYMKQLLKQMRLKGHISTKPLIASDKKQRPFGYFIPSKASHTEKLD